MHKIFADIPEAIENTHVIAQRCSVIAEQRSPMLPRYTEDEDKELCSQANFGLKRRISTKANIDEIKYQERLNYELNIITNMHYSGYFLIVADFINWSKAHGIPVGPGRGSGAGSLVAWALNISDCDPLEFGLFFERFLNPERISMPDFDIDFCQYRRDEVIDYVRNKYGKDKVAHILTFGKLQARAALRDVARVISYKGVDRICKMLPNNPANPITLQEALSIDKDLQELRRNDVEAERLFSIALKLEGMNRHVSTHAAGVVIANQPIDEIVPLYKDINSEIPVLQYSMKYVEMSGLVKFDFLGLKTLTTIAHAAIIIKIKKKDFDITKIPMQDAKTFSMLSEGRSIGVFQFEGSGLREAMKKIKPDNIEDLIALTSLYRPGPMENIPKYINRKHGKEEHDYIHPKLETILKETYGIIVYQEQVMQIAQVLSGYTLGEADILRRAMGKKIKSEMDAQRNIFVDGAVKNGVNKNHAIEIFELVAKFASYGFPKPHAAAYSIIAYQTAYLKANYTIEFFVASINLELDDSNKISMLCSDLNDFGIKVLLPDINKSEGKFVIEGNEIRYGLGAVKNVSVSVVDAIVKIRGNKGEFSDIFDFIRKCGSKIINKRILEGLILSGSFDKLYDNRRELIANIELLIKYSAVISDEQQRQQKGLFEEVSEIEDAIPVLKQLEKWSYNEQLKYEFGCIGFYLSSHPLQQYKLKLIKKKFMSSQMIPAMAKSNAKRVNIAGVILSMKVRSSKRGKYAFLQLSDLDGIYDVGIFKEELLTNENLEAGKLVCLNVDIKSKEGEKVVVNDIRALEDVLSNVIGYYNIYITDKSAVGHIKSAISDYGNNVTILAKLPENQIIKFSFLKHLCINDSDIEKLRNISGIAIEEVQCR